MTILIDRIIEKILGDSDDGNCIGYENMVNTTKKLDKPKEIEIGIELFYMQRYREAREYFLSAVKKYNSGHALRYLGRIENKLGNYKEALEYYKKGIERKDGKSIYYLGRAYHLGLGVKRDLSMALKYYKKAIECGRINGVISKIHRVFLEERNPSGFLKYLKWYERYAKKHKVKEAWYKIGLYYEDNNFHILEDIDKAKKAFEMASKYGDCRANIKLANFYIKGIGVGKNISKAEKYLESAKKECPDEVEKFEEELTII